MTALNSDTVRKAGILSPYHQSLITFGWEMEVLGIWKSDNKNHNNKHNTRITTFVAVRDLFPGRKIGQYLMTLRQKTLVAYFWTIDVSNER